jgi:hypothetical protein
MDEFDVAHPNLLKVGANPEIRVAELRILKIWVLGELRGSGCRFQHVQQHRKTGLAALSIRRPSLTRKDLYLQVC